MQFTNNSQAIYLQIADYICEKILLAEWNVEEKIPSVRDLAVQLEVNPNTVARTYDFLKQRDIIYDKRGIGYFIASQGVKNAIAYLRKEFTQRELPNVFRTMYLLGVEVEDLKSGFDKFKKQYTKN